MTRLALYVSVPLMVGGLIAWMTAAEVARAWLTRHDRSVAPASPLHRALAGGLFLAISPVRDYVARRRALGQPAPAAWAFWSGLVVSFCGFALFAAYLLGRH